MAEDTVPYEDGKLLLVRQLGVNFLQNGKRCLKLLHFLYENFLVIALNLFSNFILLNLKPPL